MYKEDLTEEEQLNNDEVKDNAFVLEESSNDENKIDNSGKKVVKNIFMVLIGNIFTVLSGVLVGFVVPKIMSQTDYGYYKIYTLYVSYVGILQLGFNEGINLAFGGKKYDTLNKEKLRRYFRILLYFQLIITLITCGISLMFINTPYGYIVFFLGAISFAMNVFGFYQSLSQAVGAFKEITIVNFWRTGLTFASVLIFVILYKTNVISTLSYKLYIISIAATSFIEAIWFMIRFRDITFGKAASFKEEKGEALRFIKMGFPLLIANLVSSLILALDRQFVSVLFSKEDYAIYAFAYNMVTLITTAISAISMVLFPTIKTYSLERLKTDYRRLIAIIAIFVSFCLLSYFPLEFIVNHWLDKYNASLDYFKVLLPSLIFSSCVSMIMFNYYKTLNKSFMYFIISCIILALSALFNLIGYLIFKNMICMSIASVITQIIWYIIAEIYFVKKWKITNIKNFIYMAVVTSAFYLIVYFIDNVFIGCALYGITFIIITIIFYFKLLKSKFTSTI